MCHSQSLGLLQWMHPQFISGVSGRILQMCFSSYLFRVAQDFQVTSTTCWRASKSQTILEPISICLGAPQKVCFFFFFLTNSQLSVPREKLLEIYLCPMLNVGERCITLSMAWQWQFGNIYSCVWILYCVNTFIVMYNKFYKIISAYQWHWLLTLG